MLIAALLGALAVTAPAEEWKPPEIRLPAAAQHPLVACTPEELARLRAAWKASGPEHEAVARRVAEADKRIGQPLVFPPRGGQHNQWYQCDACQVALKSVDETHHQCPRCKKVYTGEPYDDVIFARTHGANLSNMTTAAWAYALTGEKKYADFAAKVLLGYAERYAKYPYHTANAREKDPKSDKSGGHLFEQTLNEAETMTMQVGPAYDLIHDSAALSPQDHETIRTGFLVPMLENIAKHRAGKSNWQTWHNAAMVWGGAGLGDASWIRRAIEDPENGFAFQMKTSVSADGMWYENSWGYHFYTFHALVATAEPLRRLGIDLWTHPALRKMCTLPVRYTMPDGSLPRFGDDVRSSVFSYAWMLEPAWHALREPAIAPVLTGAPAWDTVLLGRAVAPHDRPSIQGSEVFKGAGHAILRTRGDAGLAAAITFGPYGGFHGHLDKLSFVFFAHGQELGVDPGRAASQAYRLPIHKDWYKATLGHNAVLVDTSPQKPAEGRLEFFASTDTHAAVLASCDAAYEGVKHRRLLCITPTYLLVLDELAAGKPRRFDWVYHNRGTGVTCAAASADGRLAEKYAGQEYVNQVKVAATDQPVRAEFAGDGVTTHLTAAAAPRTEVRIGDGVGASITNRVPLVMITRADASARFAVVLEPVAKGRKPAVAAVTAEETPGGVKITVRNGDTVETVTLTADAHLTVTSGDKVLLTETSGPR